MYFHYILLTFIFWRQLTKFYGPEKKSVRQNKWLKILDRQSKLVTVSDRESKSEMYGEFTDRESQLFK